MAVKPGPILGCFGTLRPGQAVPRPRDAGPSLAIWPEATQAGARRLPTDFAVEINQEEELR